MKYKRNQIRKIKQRYNIERLHFFKGYRKRPGNLNSDLFPPFTDQIIICSLNRNYKKVYRNHPHMRATGRLTHQELGEVFEGLIHGHFINKWGGKTKALAVWLEPTNTEHHDLESLKKAYLIHYLSGI